MPMRMLTVEPETLTFCKTPSRPSPVKTLTLFNKSDGYVAFKVKTTEPKSYMVKPSSGTLRAQEEGKVTITLSSVGENITNHRFLVQAYPVKSDEPVSREDWQSKFKKDHIEELRLNVVVEVSETDQAAAPSVPGVETNDASRRSRHAEEPAAAPSYNIPAPVQEYGEAPADLRSKYDEIYKYKLQTENDFKSLQEQQRRYARLPEAEIQQRVARLGARAAQEAANKGEPARQQAEEAAKAAEEFAKFFGWDHQRQKEAATTAKNATLEGKAVTLSKANSGGAGGFSLLTIILVALVAMMLPYATKVFG